MARQRIMLAPLLLAVPVLLATGLPGAAAGPGTEGAPPARDSSPPPSPTAGARASPTATTPPRRPLNLRARLLAQLAADSLAEARALIGEHRVGTVSLVESLLVEQDEALARGGAAEAAGQCERLTRLVDLYTATCADSVCHNLLHFRTGLAGEARRIDREGWRTLRRAQALYAQSRWAETLDSLAAAGELARRAGDRHLESLALTLTGSCHWMTGDYGTARDAYQSALVLAESLRDQIQQARLLRNVAGSYNMQGRSRETAAPLDRALALARGLGYWSLYVQALNDRAILHQSEGDLAAAEAEFIEVLRLAREQGQRALEGNAEMNLGMTLTQEGRPLEALDHLEQALAISREGGRLRQQVAALLDLAYVNADLQRHCRRLTCLRDVLALTEQNGPADVAAQALNEIGDTYRRLGRPRDAIPCHERALAVFRERGILRSESLALQNLGLAYASLGDLAAAGRCFDAQAAALRSSGLPGEVAAALLNQGWIRSRGGDLQTAARILERAAAIADSVENFVLLDDVDNALGQLRLQAGDPDGAAASFARALERTGGCAAAFGQWRALAGLADARNRQGRRAEAAELLAKAIEQIESMRGQQSGGAFRQAFMTDKRDVYALRVGVLQALDAERGGNREVRADAFLTAERARARVLLDILAAAQPGAATAGDSLLWQRYRAQVARLNRLQTELGRVAAAGTWEPARFDSLTALRDQARSALLAARDELAARDPSYLARTGQREPLGAEEIRARVLGPGQVLFEYVTGNDRSYLFRLDARDLQLIPIPCGADSLAVLVNALRDALRGQAGGGAGPPGDSGTWPQEAGPPRPAGTGSSPQLASLALARQLYDLLIAPGLKDLPPDSRLLICPDGPLLYLPFAALHDGQAFLGERHPISSTASASALDPSLYRRGRSPRENLLALGNPSSFRSQELLAADVRDARDWAFGELPFAEAEVRRIGARFAHARVLVGPEATEEAVKANIERASHVHFATHGMLSDGEPLMSALVLAQDDDPAEDGLLQTYEILDLHLNADLVVLSACNTGLGDLVHGEGILGLTHAFLCSGARTLLMSLWEVPDQSTAELMDRFYAGLGEGLAPDLALQATMREAAALGLGPGSWAGFTLLGSATPPAGTGRGTLIHLFTQRLVWRVVGLALLAVAVAGWLAAVARARHRPAR